MKATVYRLAELRKMGMGGLLAVGAGSSHAPRLVRLEWGRRGPTVALVGKGVTFDTGGISIKPAADMDEMKYDKCGACTVLGAARAVARPRPAGAAARLPAARREHADGPRLPAGRHRPLLQRQDGRDHQHRRRGAADPRRRAGAGRRGAARLHASRYSTLTGACVVALGQQRRRRSTAPTTRLAGELLAAADDARRAALAHAAVARVPARR